jgi:hypothetical protein
MSFSSASSPACRGRHRLGLAFLFSILACGCFSDPKIDPTQTRHCKDDKSCPWGSVCGTNGICCESADGKTCKALPGGLDATAVDSSRDTGHDVGYDGAGGDPGWDGSIDTAADSPPDAPQVTYVEAGSGEVLGADGTGQIDAPNADGLDAPLGGTGGAPGSGGLIGSGGIAASGGAVGSGGTVATGGVVGSGGIPGTGGATCQPKPRDCTSSLDNDCNGTPDKQETTFCVCPVGQAHTCQEHPGYDGTGICKAGSQTCAASADKTTSSWGACSDAVGPGTRNCTSSADNDCNGTPDSQETAYCVCSAGKAQSCQPAGACTAGSQTCGVSSDKATTAWGPCNGYTGPGTQYRDYDGDSYGNPAQSAQVCPGTSGYVGNADDCDDANSAFKPGVSICSTVTQRKTCVSGGGGTASVETCDQGCINGSCRTDGTIGLPGYVSCTATHTPRCLAADGCNVYDGTCGATSSFVIYCDGPNDCPSGQQCWFTTVRGFTESKCYATPPDNNYYLVCDPLVSACTAPLVCTPFGDIWYFSRCQ